jgi:hypothetical protein
MALDEDSPGSLASSRNRSGHAGRSSTHDRNIDLEANRNTSGGT